MASARGWVGRSMTIGVFTVGAAGMAAGQEPVLPGPAFVGVAGGIESDVEGADTGLQLGLRIDFPLSRRFVMEAGIERATWSAASVDETRWTGDLAARAERAFGRVVPYVGANIGLVANLEEDRSGGEEFIEGAYGAHAGVRVDLNAHVGLRGELRARWLDGLERHWTLLTAGVSWRP